jgi:hypothetical protein
MKINLYFKMEAKNHKRNYTRDKKKAWMGEICYACGMKVMMNAMNGNEGVKKIELLKQ